MSSLCKLSQQINGDRETDLGSFLSPLQSWRQVAESLEAAYLKLNSCDVPEPLHERQANRNAPVRRCSFYLRSPKSGTSSTHRPLFSNIVFHGRSSKKKMRDLSQDDDFGPVQIKVIL